jgi:hypothetical protein
MPRPTHMVMEMGLERMNMQSGKVSAGYFHRL